MQDAQRPRIKNCAARSVLRMFVHNLKDAHFKSVHFIMLSFPHWTIIDETQITQFSSGIRHQSVLQKGTCILQTDSGSDSDSESQNKNEEIIPVNHLTQTVCRNDFLILVPTLRIGVVTWICLHNTCTLRHSDRSPFYCMLCNSQQCIFDLSSFTVCTIKAINL